MKLDPDTLKSLYGEPDAAFAGRMQQLIRRMPEHKEEQNMRHIPKRLILFAALILMALTTTAYAVSRPAVLDWLLGFSPAGDALTQTVQEIRAEAKADGIAIRVTSLVWDGSQFAVAYEAEAEEPTQAALFRLEPVFTIGGREAAFPSYLEPEMHIVPSTRLDLAPVQRNPVAQGQWSGAIEGLSGQTECALTFRIYRPEKAFVFLIGPEDDLRRIDEQEADYQADLRDRMNCLQSLRNAIIPDADQQDEAYWIAQGYTVGGENLCETAAVTVRFTFDADRVQTRDYSGVADIALKDATVHIARFRLSPLVTNLDVRLIPQENTQEAAQALANRYGEGMLTDGNGEPVIYSDMDSLSDETPYVTCMDGQWVCRYVMELPGLEVFPEAVAFRTQAGELLRFE